MYKSGLDEEKVTLANLMANKYFCNVSECIKLMLPPGTTSKRISSRVKDKEMKFVYLTIDEEEIEDEIENRQNQIRKTNKDIKIFNAK